MTRGPDAGRLADPQTGEAVCPESSVIDKWSLEGNIPGAKDCLARARGHGTGDGRHHFGDVILLCDRFPGRSGGDRIGRSGMRPRLSAVMARDPGRDAGRWSVSVLPRVILAVSDIDVQVVERSQYFEGVGLHPPGGHSRVTVR